MRTIEHTVSHLIIHDLAKEPGSPARLMLRDAPCMLDAQAPKSIPSREAITTTAALTPACSRSK